MKPSPSNSGCYIVGRDENRQVNSIDVGDATIKMRSAFHMLFHVLGRYHEHQRQDRNEYVQINWMNILEGEEINYKYEYWGTIIYMYIYK